MNDVEHITERLESDELTHLRTRLSETQAALEKWNVRKCISPRVVTDCNDLHRHVGEVATAMLKAIEHVNGGCRPRAGLEIAMRVVPGEGPPDPPSGAMTARPQMSEMKEMSAGNDAAARGVVRDLQAELIDIKAALEREKRTVASIATMLGWGNVPPQSTLESDIRALKARVQAAEASLERAQQERNGLAECMREVAMTCRSYARVYDLRGDRPGLHETAHVLNNFAQMLENGLKDQGQSLLSLTEAIRQMAGEMDVANAQLRHAYTQLLRDSEPPWAVPARRSFAYGLVGPQVERLEKLRDRLVQLIPEEQNG